MMTNITKKYRLSIIAAVTAALIALAAVACFFGNRVQAKAEGDRTVVLHVYDPNQEYAKLSGWFWLKNGKGAEVKISTSAAADEPFSKSYELNGSQVTNSARTFSVTYTEAQLNKQSQIGFLVCHEEKGGSDEPFWRDYKKETADIFIETKNLEFVNNTAHVYYIRKDVIVYTDLEGAKMSLEKVTGAKFTSKSTVEFESTSPVTDDTQVVLYGDDNSTPLYTKKATKLDSFKGSVTFTELANSFDFAVGYKIKVGNIPTVASVAKDMLLDEVGFIQAFETKHSQEEVEYGAIYTPESTTFNVWAPLATSASVRIYADGTAGVGEPLSVFHMNKLLENNGRWGGVWSTTVKGDYKNKYYTYYINNSGNTVETIDPYAKASGVSGDRGMIVDLKSTDPEGWENDKHLYASHSANADLPIIWELQVKDFSASPDSGMKYKGKFLAFTETGTKVPGTNLKTGVDYLKDLGITYVHLNPVYDYSSVDETTASDVDNQDNYNWGYDPVNYNIPEGSYSTNPYDGNVRITEFKQMVMALHKAGIGVIMDVVYNHTATTSGIAVADTVPGYYYRTGKDGKYTDGSGCGNEAASERTMVRKFMADSIRYWAEEYHIDGFRFDLMGVHDVITMNTIREELDALDLSAINGTGAKGNKILLYGEPWTGDGKHSTDNIWVRNPNQPDEKADDAYIDSGVKVKYSYHTRVNNTQTNISGTGKYTSNANNLLIVDMYDGALPYKFSETLNPRVAVFNGEGRDGIRGSTWDIEIRKGWIQNGDGSGAGSTRGMIWGGNRELLASQSVAYASAHDNFTLWDHLLGKNSGTETPLFYDAPMDDYMHQSETVAAAYLMSRGMSFMIAGEEMARTKYGNHNSYNSPIKVNQLDWSRQAIFADMYNFYKTLIKIRKAYPEFFSYDKAQNRNAVTVKCDPDGEDTSVIVLEITATGTTKKLKAVFNSKDVGITANFSGYSHVYVSNGSVGGSGGGGNITINKKCCVIAGSEAI